MEVQNYENHTRWVPPFHFFLAPLMLLNLIYAAVRIFQDPNWDRGMFLLLSIGLVVLTLLSRTHSLRVQDRLIRLEETLRYKNTLSGDLAEQAVKLRTGQIIGLRFASDEELPDLVERTIKGEFESQKEIKMAIKNWRADYLRT